jgi:hypothetical protein
MTQFAIAFLLSLSNEFGIICLPLDSAKAASEFRKRHSVSAEMRKGAVTKRLAGYLLQMYCPGRPGWKETAWVKAG